MMKNYLIVDIGTGNSRVALVNSEREIKDIETFENHYYVDDHYEDAQYFSPNYLQRQILDAMRSVMNRNKGIHIDAISSSGARQSSVLINREFQNVIGLPNIDNRGKAFMNEIVDKKTVYQKTGSWVTEDCIASKIYGLKKVREDIYDEVYSFTSLSEWVGLFLTNTLCIEPSQATETLLFDLNENKFSKDLIQVFGLEQLMMPKIENAGTNIGNLTDEIKEKLSVDYEIPFVVGGADTQIAALGAGMKVGDIGVVSGTTSPVVTLVPEKYIDSDMGCWTGLGLGAKGYQVETNPGVTGLNYQRIKKLLFDKVSYDDLEYAMSEIKDIKCTAFFTSLDFANQSGYPMGGFFMKPPFNQNLHREDMAWAVVADIACAIYHQYTRLSKATNNHSDMILCCGGGFQSRTLRQNLADLTQKTLRLPENYQQSSVLGAVMVCNEYFNIPTNIEDKAVFVKPNSDKTLILDYYKKWEENRLKILNDRREK